MTDDGPRPEARHASQGTPQEALPAAKIAKGPSLAAAVPADASSVTPRETRISAEELQRELQGKHASAEARAEAVRRAQVWENAAAAEAGSAKGINPYVYQPRRGLRIGDEYQADIPDFEGPPPQHAAEDAGAAAAAIEATQGKRAASPPAAMDTAADEAGNGSGDATPAADATLTAKTRALDERLQAITMAAAGDMEQARACLGGLARILARILAEPSNSKVQRVNTQSGPFQRLAGAALKEACAFLQEVGFSFEDDGAHLKLARNDLGLLWLAKDMLAAANTVALGSLLTRAEEQEPMNARA